MQVRFASVSGEVQCSTSPYVPNGNGIRTELQVFWAAAVSLPRLYVVPRCSARWQVGGSQMLIEEFLSIAGARTARMIGLSGTQRQNFRTVSKWGCRWVRYVCDQRGFKKVLNDRGRNLGRASWTGTTHQPHGNDDEQRMIRGE